MQSRVQSIRRIADTVLIALFVVAIGLPVVDMVVKFDQTPNTEMRTLAPAPTFAMSVDALKGLPKAIRDWAGDHFGFRNLMIRWHGVMMVKGLGVSSSPQVVLGEIETDAGGNPLGQWLYYSAHNTMEYHLGRVPLSDEHLARWKQTLEQRRDWLAARGCRYVFVIAPNAQSIYPQFLPDAYRRVGRQTRADQLIAYLRGHSDIEIIDTRESLLEARQAQPALRTYHRTDTHWNDAGSFIAYRQIAGRLRDWYPSVEPLRWEQFEVTAHTSHGGDLAALLGIQNLFQEEIIALRFKPPLARRVPRERHDDRKLTVENQEAAARGAPVMVMFRDSFGATLQPFLAEHFAKSVFVWSDQFHPEYIEEHRPRLVISQMVERFLWRDPPVNAWLDGK